MSRKIGTFPTIAAIILAILALGIPLPGVSAGTPWMVAHHQQTMADGATVNVDNLVFYLWGQDYTVIGTKAIQSQYTAYDWRDFPFYSMIGVTTAILVAVLALVSDKGIYYTVKGRNLRFKDKFNPLHLLAISIILTAASLLYLYDSANYAVVPLLESQNYISYYSYGMQFMGASALAFMLSFVVTLKNIRRENQND
ncbi:MAG: hypothetical protein M8350_08555 [Methanosarcinaceae archaeon]|nr:hypothetical protein [Methanosarcinaceae archaeon]